MKSIHLWCQSFEASPGGIQTFTEFTVKALCELYPKADITVFAKNDRSSPSRSEVGRQKSEVGFGSQKQGGKNVDGVADDCTSAHGTDSSFGERVACAPRIIGFGRWQGKLRAIAFALSALRSAWLQRDLLIFSTHANFVWLAAIVKKLSRARVAVVGHGIEVWNIASARRRRSLCSVDQLLAVSDFTRRRLAGQLGVPAESIELLPNTFDEQRFKLAEKSAELLRRYGLTDDMPVILTVARLATAERYKGYDSVILSLPEVLRRFPTARYLIAGDGPDRSRAEAVGRSLGILERVVFSGYVPNESLAAHYNLCDVFAMPGKGEGFGIVFLEAMGCGKPVIGSNKDASNEPLQNGRLGKLVDPDDVSAIAAAICDTLAEVRSQTSEVRQEQSEWRRKEVVDAFGYERFKEKLGQIVEKMKSLPA